MKDNVSYSIAVFSDHCYDDATSTKTIRDLIKTKTEPTRTKRRELPMGYMKIKIVILVGGNKNQNKQLNITELVVKNTIL